MFSTSKGTTLTLVTTWRTCSIKSFIFIFFHTPSENTEMLQRDVSDSTWKGTEKTREQPLYQQTVAIDWWHSSTGNVLPQGVGWGDSTLSLEKTKDLCKALMQIAKQRTNDTTDDNKKIKKIKNNNWAPSKIRLRLGAEVDKN